MTHAQEEKVNLIRRQAECLRGKHSDKYEVKQWQVDDTEWGTVIVFVEVGLKNDEGTMAEVLCRDKCQIFIGKRGAAKYPVYHFRKDGSIHDYYKPFRDLWTACYEYNAH